LLCGFVGVALIAIPQTSLPTPEMAAWLPLAMVGPVFYAMEGNYVAKWGMGDLDAVQAMFWASLLAALLALPLALGMGQWIDPRPPYGTPELALMASSTIHALMYAAYVWLAAKAGAVFATQTSYVVTLSGVLWAMLLLDEHTAALDPRSAEQVIRITDRIVARDRLTTMMVTHSMQQAVHLGDRIVMMHRGQVLHDLQGAERARVRPEDLLKRFDDVRRREQLDSTVAEMLQRNYV
jgi:hypothetical protein